jgi:hypothetical protein
MHAVPQRVRQCLAVGAVLLVTLSSCETPPPPAVAAMVARSSNGDFGYSEKSLAADLYVVTYVSPRLHATREPDDDHALGAEKQRVYDLALWRAAQLALEKGYPDFKVQQESRDVDVTVPAPAAYPAYPPVPLFVGHRCRWDCDWPFGFWPYPYYDPYYADQYSRAHTTGRITVNLTVKMLPKPADDSLDATETEARLRKAYASASFSATRAGY